MIALGLLLTVVAIPTTSSSPPPIIITTKTSALCNAVRTVIAPTVQGLIVQDANIDRGRSLLQDMAKMHVAHGDAWVKFDNVRLLSVVDNVAANNVKVHQLLEKLDDLALKDPAEAAEVNVLQAHLKKVADAQAETLNDLSGTADSQALAEIMGFQNPMVKSLRPDAQADRSDATVGSSGASLSLPREFSYGNLFTSNLYGSIAVDVALRQSGVGREESAISSALQPIINRCK